MMNLPILSPRFKAYIFIVAPYARDVKLAAAHPRKKVGTDIRLPPPNRKNYAVTTPLIDKTAVAPTGNVIIIAGSRVKSPSGVTV